MRKQSGCTGSLLPAMGAAGVGLVWALLPARWALRGRKAGVVDGVATVDDAVDACRASGGQGWELVTFAQRLVYRKFTLYSCRNLGDTPAQAFRYGMGYCTQYNLALKQILERLSFPVRAVLSLKVRVYDEPGWSMGHTWLRVTFAGETRDVCAGHADNLPGQVGFRPELPVLPGAAPVLLVTHLGMISFCGFLEWRSVVTGEPLPPWTFVPRA